MSDHIPEAVFADAWAAYVATPTMRMPGGSLSDKGAVQAAVKAALACDRRLRATDAHGVDWHAQALKMERERDVEQSYRLEAQDMQRKAEADLAALTLAHEKERNVWQQSLQLAHDQRDRADKERRTTIECGAERIRVLQNEIAAAQVTIAGQGEKHIALCKMVCLAENALTRAGWVRCDGEAGWKMGPGMYVGKIQHVEHPTATTPDDTELTIDHFVFLAEAYAFESDSNLTPSAIVLANKVRQAIAKLRRKTPIKRDVPSATAGSAGETVSPYEAAMRELDHADMTIDTRHRLGCAIEAAIVAAKGRDE